MLGGSQDPPVGKGFYVALWASIAVTAMLAGCVAWKVLENADKEVCSRTITYDSNASCVCGGGITSVYED